MGQHATQPNQHQAEILAQIGDYLHQIREDRLLSLEQVAAQTMIQARLLRAIETADLNQLPEPIYIRGFIRRYAEALGLNGGEIAASFPVEPDSRAIQPSWQNSAAQLRPTHLWIAYTLLIVAAVGGLHQYLTRYASSVDGSADTSTATVEGAASTSPSPETASSTEAPAGNTDTASSEAPDAASTSQDADAADQPLRVEVRLTQKSWLRVVVDGKQELEEVLPEGSQRSWTGTQQITIRAGNAGGVLLAHNDSEAEVMGESGAVREVTFSADGSGNDEGTSVSQSTTQ